MLSLPAVMEHFYSRRAIRANAAQWFKIAALTAALLSLLVVATGATLWHQDSPGTVCSICYAAHLPALRGSVTSTPTSPFVVCWIVTGASRVRHAEPESLQSPPRGPPSA
jgi:hypothetical protein